MNDLVKVEYEAPQLPAVTAKAYAEMFEIDDQTTYEIADSQLGDVKRRWREVEAQRVAIVDPINKAKDAVQKLFKPVLDDLAAAETVLKTKMLTFTRAQDQRRREEQAELDRKAREERERLEKQAAKAEKKGDVEKASMLTMTAAVIAPAIATSTYVQPRGTGTRKVWKARVTDRTAVLKSLIDNPSFIDAVLTFNEGGLNRLAGTLNGQVPLNGIECYEDDILSKRVA